MKHWIYTSQYVKTCLLTQGIVKKALLVYERHQSFIDKEYRPSIPIDVFVRENKSIDMEVKYEKNRKRTVKKIFIAVDIFAVVLIPVS